MRKHILIVMTAILVLATVAMAADPFVGTWKLNLAKSTYTPAPGPPPKSSTRTITVQGNGYKLVSDGVNAEGKPIHLEDTYLNGINGKEHPVTGNPGFDSEMATKIDSNTIIGARKKDGKEAGSMRLVVSKDGKTLKLTIKGKNAKGEDFTGTAIYDKQ